MNTERKKVPVFTKEKKKNKILSPMFSQFYSGILEKAMRNMGYDVVTLPPPDRESVDVGLKYTNNDMCYPATVVIGDLIKALQSGEYDLETTTVALTQTGGQCRASSYISLLKHGLLSAGFDNIPVVAVGTTGVELNEQPGFKLKKLALLRHALHLIPFSDCIAQMHYYTRCREINKGETQKLTDKYLALINEKHSVKRTMALLKNAIKEYNAIDINNDEKPKAGIVGEIYVKYSDFANNNIVDWLTDNGVEVIVPPIVDFLTQFFINVQSNKEQNARPVSLKGYYSAKFAEKYFNRRMKKFEVIMSDFRGFRPRHTIRELSKLGGKVINLAHQYGETWVLSAEILAMADAGIENVVSMQPFGCIANHIIARGIEKRLKEINPKINILYLDMDAGVSEANNENRLKFFVKTARDKMLADNNANNNTSKDKEVVLI